MTSVRRDYPAELARARAGDPVALSRLITAVESRRALTDGVMPYIYAEAGKARLIGVTGPPGSGKSTLTSALLRELRSRDETVAVLAVDPSSVASGGAILGDRLRMTEHSGDTGVYIRSMSARGAIGGLSPSAGDAAAVLDAAGWDTIIVETVGAGQDEVDVVRLAHTVLVVSVPGLGDDVQAMKAGLLEIADLHVVNKADRGGAGQAAAEIRAMLRQVVPREPGRWRSPVLQTVALDGTGISELAGELDRHRDWLASSGELERRRLAAAMERIRSEARDLLVARLASPALAGRLAGFAQRVADRQMDPRAAAQLLISDDDET